MKVVCLSPFPEGLVKSAIAPAIPEIEVNVVMNASKIKEEVRGADAILGDYTMERGITKEMLLGAKRLKLVQQPSTGFDHIDVEGCADLGIPVANIGGANSISVVEHTIMMVLALLKRLVEAHLSAKSGQWAQHDFIYTKGIYELMGKTWGIMGMGRIGRLVAKRLKGFETRTIYYDVVRLDEDLERKLNVEYRNLAKLMKESDVISLHLPLTEQTEGIMGKREFEMMKPNCIVVNTARGKLIDKEALIGALRGRKLFGAALDVFHEEPIFKDDPLLKLDNVLLTPHLAGATREAAMRIFITSIDNIIRVIKGQKPLNVVNGVE